MVNKRNNFFIKGFFVIGGGTVLNMAIALLTTPIITRMVAPENYGQLNIFLVYSEMAINIFCVGLDQAFIRFYYDHDSLEYRRNLLSRCVRLPVCVTILSSVTVYTMTKREIISWAFSRNITVLLFANILSSVVYSLSILLLRMEKKVKLYSFLSVLQKALYVAIVLVLLLSTEIDHFTVLALATVSAVLVCLTISILATKQFWIPAVVPKQIQASWNELFKYGWPLVFSVMIGSAFQAIDKLSLRWYCSYTEVGVYASAMSLVGIFRIIQTTFYTLWTPISLERYATSPEDTAFYSSAHKILTVVMFFLGMSLILCKDLFAVLLGEKYRQCAFMLPFLVLYPIMSTVSETTCVGLVFQKKSKLEVVAMLVPCFTNIVGNLILVPRLAGVGASISTGISYVIYFLVRTVLSNRYYKVNFQLKRFLIVTAVACVYALYNTVYRFGIVSVIGYLLCVLTLVFMYPDTVKFCLDYTKTILLDIFEQGYAKLHK